MSKKNDFIIALNSLKEHFNINDLNDYQELIDIFNTINLNKESDEDILDCFAEIINTISTKQSVQNNCPNLIEEYCPNIPIDNLPDNTRFCDHSRTFQELFKQEMFNPLNPDFNYTNILERH